MITTREIPVATIQKNIMKLKHTDTKRKRQQDKKQKMMDPQTRKQ